MCYKLACIKIFQKIALSRVFKKKKKKKSLLGYVIKAHLNYKQDTLDIRKTKIIRTINLNAVR